MKNYVFIQNLHKLRTNKVMQGFSAACLQYFGGTNFGRSSGGPFYVTSYDYDAPIDEYGECLNNRIHSRVGNHC